MSLIHCSSDCLYQNDGYCDLDNAAEITNCSKTGGCLHYLPKESTRLQNNAAEVKKQTASFY